jgi:hypothetical protein
MSIQREIVCLEPPELLVKPAQISYKLVVPPLPLNPLYCLSIPGVLAPPPDTTKTSPKITSKEKVFLCPYPSHKSLLRSRAPHGLTAVLHCRRAMFGITRTFVNLSNSMAEYGFLVSPSSFYFLEYSSVVCPYFLTRHGPFDLVRLLFSCHRDDGNLQSVHNQSAFLGKRLSCSVSLVLRPLCKSCDEPPLAGQK